MLELAILGLLHEAPVHGYELRKQLRLRLGRAPGILLRLALPGPAPAHPRRPDRRGGGPGDHPAPDATGWSRRGRRGRRVYRITAEGKERFAETARRLRPAGVGRHGFGVHLAFFSRTPAETRMRILEGRRRAVEERREGLRTALGRAGEQIDHYTRELHQLGLDRQRARGPLAERADRQRTGGTAVRRRTAQNPPATTPGTPPEDTHLRRPEHDQQ